MMRRFPAGLVICAMLGSTAICSPSLAQTAPASPSQTNNSPPAQPGPDAMIKTSKAFFDAKLAGLRAGLVLTPEQTPLWAPIETAIRDLAKEQMAAGHPEDDDNSAKADGPEQLKRTSEQMIQRGQARKALADAAGPLLATLSDDQKERLPKLLEGLKPKWVLWKAFNVSRGQDAGRNSDENRSFDQDRHRHDADEGYGRGRDGSREGDRDHDHYDRNSDDHGSRDREFQERDRGWDRGRGRDRNDAWSDHSCHENRQDDREPNYHERQGSSHHQDGDDDRT
jgi:zinc resistance-associated protein